MHGHRSRNSAFMVNQDLVTAKNTELPHKGQKLQFLKQPLETVMVNGLFLIFHFTSRALKVLCKTS